MIRKWSKPFAGAYVLLACLTYTVFGCASATVTPESSTAPAGIAQKPDKIIVYDFAVSAENVTENQGPLQRAYRAVAKNDEQNEADKLATGQEAAHELSQDLVKQLQALGFTVENVPRGTPVSGNVLVVDGQLVSADEGKRARRMIVGFGAGASKMETEVNVSQISNGATQQVLSFQTNADSGKMPGAAVTMGAGAAAQTGGAAMAAGTAVTSAGKVYNSTFSTLASKTSKQITAYLSQYFASQKWISPDQVQTATVE